MERAIQESLWEEQLRRVETELKRNETEQLMVHSIELEEKYAYCGDNKHRNIPYSLVHRRVQEMLSTLSSSSY